MTSIPPRNGEGDRSKSGGGGGGATAARAAAPPPASGWSPSPFRGGIRQLIVTADDFGAALVVNEAVEQAHTLGILTAASLMVSGEAAGDAVARAKRMPKLGVGLHLVLVDGRPMLPPARVPDLIDEEGRFRSNMALAGVRFFFSPRVRKQLAAEIEAQFAAFAQTGLTLDHVNAHKHFHLHPTITGLILEIGARYGLTAARAPVEPAAVIDAIDPIRRGLADRIAAPWAQATRKRLIRAGLTVPDQVFGLAWSGAMTAPRVHALVANLPTGLSEIYFHPATADQFSGHAAGYRYRDELAALTDPQVREALVAQGVRSGRFADFAEKGQTHEQDGTDRGRPAAGERHAGDTGQQGSSGPALPYPARHA